MTVAGFVVDWKILLLLTIAVLLLAFILYKLICHVIRRNKSLDRFLRKHFHDVIPHAELPDSMGGNIFADFLALNADGIYVIHYRDYPGILFGGEKLDQWTQVIGSKSYRFDNPLYHNQLFLNEVGRLVQGVPVTGVLVFSDQGDFPRARPDGVFLCREFRESFVRQGDVPIPGGYFEQWSKLKALLSRS